MSKAQLVEAAPALRLPGLRWDPVVRERARVAAELLVVLAWTLVVTRPYLNLDPALIPVGTEYGQDIMPHHFWTGVRECGLCALWFGGARGGTPALVEPVNSSLLHPLVIVPTLGWGVVNGAKLAVAGAFAMAGLAQWWLGCVLGVGRVARVWSALLAVAGGHLAARMELGAFATLFATAACALVLPPLVALCRTGSRRQAVLLGLMLALAALGGRWYLQVGLAFALPAVLLLLPWDRQAIRLLARRFALAAGIALLLIGPFLVPFLHFLPEFAKDAADPSFRAAQPLLNVPLNLVISDLSLYTGQVLSPLPWPSHYVLFVGWIPVGLALWGLLAVRTPPQRRAVLFLTATALLVFWVASAAPLTWLAHTVPIPRITELVTGVRYPSFIAGLAVPPILALAAIGLDRLFALRWPRPSLALGDRWAVRRVALNTRWLLSVPLGLAVVQTWAFGSQWISVWPSAGFTSPVVEALRTPELQWVAIPFGQHWFTEPAVGTGLKLADDFRTWSWNGRPFPEPVLEAHTAPTLPGMTSQGVVAGFVVHAALPGREYAAVTHPDGGRTVCTAQGRGGDLDVRCAAPAPGLLVVKENSWDGWRAYVDWAPVPLEAERWLAVRVPAGHHTIQLRYRPADASLGLALGAAGVLLAAWQWRRPDTLRLDDGAALSRGPE